MGVAIGWLRSAEAKQRAPVALLPRAGQFRPIVLDDLLHQVRTHYLPPCRRHHVDAGRLCRPPVRLVAVWPASLPTSGESQDSAGAEYPRRRYGLIPACTNDQPAARPFGVAPEIVYPRTLTCRANRIV